MKDRYADNGLVGVSVLRWVGDRCEIEALLMSCHVISRGVETGFLSILIEEARRRGAKSLTAWFLLDCHLRLHP